MDYKNLLSSEQFNEAKIGVVNKSELNDNWSPSYHFSEDIQKVKKDYKTLGRKGIIDKVVSITKKIGEKDYKEAVKLAKSEYNQNLPKYESIIKSDYWKGGWSTMAKLIIILASLKGSVKKSKETIAEDIKVLNDRLKTLETINESWEDNYEDFLGEVAEEYKLFNSSEVSDDKAYDFTSYYHGKGWLHDWWKDGLSPKEAIDEIAEKDEDGKRQLTYFK